MVMGYIERIGMNKRKSEAREFHRGFVTKSIENGTQDIWFSYNIVTAEIFTATNSMLQGLEFSTPTMTIRTTRLDIPFVKDDTINCNGVNWTVSDVNFEEDEARAMLTGNGKVAYILYLRGGKPSGNGIFNKFAK